MIKRAFLFYYLSRAVLSMLIAFLVMGVTWKAMIVGAVFFAMFVWYLHSGWFKLDMEHPVFPLRRDAYGREVQRKAFIMALLVVAIGFLLSSLPTPLPITNSVILAVGVAVFFLSEWYLFLRA